MPPHHAESADLGGPFEATLWNVVAVPRGTPAGVKKTLAEQRIFADLRIGAAAASAYVQAEAFKWQPVVAQLGGAGAIGQ